MGMKVALYCVLILSLFLTGAGLIPWFYTEATFILKVITGLILSLPGVAFTAIAIEEIKEEK